MLDKILPHKPPMILIDKLVDVNLQEKYVLAQVTIKKDMVFFNSAISRISSLVFMDSMSHTRG